MFPHKFYAVLLLLFLLVACGEPGLTPSQVNQLGTDPASLDGFQAEHGKIGAHALTAHLLQASRFLGRPLGELTPLVQKNSTVITLRPLVSQQLKDESFLLLAADATGTTPAYFDTLEIENTTGERVVILLESITGAGRSQSFSYVELEPGDRYWARHNDPTRGWGGVLAGKGARTIPEQGVKTIMRGTADGFNTAAVSLEAAFNPEVRCSLVVNKVIRNQCVGNCNGTLTCKATSKESFWLFGEEPASCGCG